MDKERFTKDAKYRAFMLAWHAWQAQEAKLQKDTKEMVEAFNREIEKQKKEQEKLIQAGKCPVCGGVGKSADGLYDCEACNGTGKYNDTENK